MKRFSEYCSGLGYIITFDLIKPMVYLSQFVKFVWVDDYFLSGILGTATNATYIDWNSLYSIFESSGQILLRYTSNSAKKKIFIHLKDIKKRKLIWFYITNRRLD